MWPRRLSGGIAAESSQCCKVVAHAVSRLRAIGVKTPSWDALSAGLRLEEGRRARHSDRDPTEPRYGWQKVASEVVQRRHREDVVWPLWSAPERASVRSQSGPLASILFMSFPVYRVTRIDSEHFRILLFCDVLGCFCFCQCAPVCVAVVLTCLATTGQRGTEQGFSAGEVSHESAVEQICREAGARVSTNVMVSDAATPMFGGWRSWKRECLCSEEYSWLWTQL